MALPLNRLSILLKPQALSKSINKEKPTKNAIRKNIEFT